MTTNRQRMTGPPTGRGFEADVNVAGSRLVRAGVLVDFERIATPMLMTPKGPRYLEKVLADFVGCARDGRAVLVEAKHTKGKSLRVRREGEKGDGLKQHQLNALIKRAAVGSYAWLLIQFETRGVWAIDGLGLREWDEGGDEDNRESSISIEHLIAWGDCLGTRHDWQMSDSMFQRSER